jgi:hypothetical protein
MVMSAAHDRYWLFVCWRTRGYTKQSWISALAVIFAVAAATLPPASPALASIPGWEVVSQRSAIDSISKTVSASCRPGKVAIGGGYRIVDGDGEVDARSLFIGKSFVVADGFEDPTGYSKDWYIIAYAVCSDPLPGLEKVQAFAPVSSASTRGVRVACPPGKRVVGTGFSTEFASSDATRIASLVPDSTLTSVHASAYAVSPTG